MERLNTILDKIATETGLSKSSIIEKAVEEYIIKKLDSDTKRLSSLEFSDLPSEDDWIKIQSEIN